MPTITTRRLDPVTWEPMYGNGQGNFIADLDAVAQILACNLKLFQGEWFLNLNSGVPMFKNQGVTTSILGSSGSAQSIQAITNILTRQILASAFVTSIVSLLVTFESRRYTFNAAVATAFGTVFISNAPGLNAVLST